MPTVYVCQITCSNLLSFRLQILDVISDYAFVCVDRKYGRNHRCAQMCSVVLEESVLLRKRVNQPVSVLR